MENQKKKHIKKKNKAQTMELKISQDSKWSLKQCSQGYDHNFDVEFRIMCCQPV